MKTKVNIKCLVVICTCILLVVVTGVFVEAGPKKKDGFGKRPGGRQDGFGGQETVVPVKTRIAEKNVLHDYVKTNGEIESKSSIAVFPDIGGKVYRNFVGLGDIVKKGNVIAEIDPSEPGSYFAHSQVYAPVSGTIIASPLEPGTKVSTQSVITTIGDVSNLQINVKIIERFASYMKAGLKAKIVLEAFQDEVFDATVEKVSPVLDKTSRTKEVILNFDRIDERVNAGMFAKVTLFTVDYEGMVTVPATCIVTKGRHNYVFVVSEDGNTAVKKEVTLYNSVENEVQVEGVNVGERVVVEGMSVLTDGSKVKDIGAGKSR